MMISFHLLITTTNPADHTQGIRASGNIPAGPTSQKRSPRSRGVLHHPLYRPLREDRHEDTDLRRASSGGLRALSNVSNSPSDCLLQILTKDSVTVFVNAIMYYKVRGDKILQQGKSILKVKDGLFHCIIDALVVSICLLSTLLCFQVLL